MVISRLLILLSLVVVCTFQDIEDILDTGHRWQWWLSRYSVKIGQDGIALKPLLLDCVLSGKVATTHLGPKCVYAHFGPSSHFETRF